MENPGQPAAERVRALPLWHGLRSIVPLSGGVSNASFLVDDQTGRYVARVGDNYPFHQVDREREAIASRAAHRAGLSPEVLHAADGILVIRHVDAQTYQESDVQKHWPACIELVSRSHHRMGRLITGQGAIFWVFQILRDYGTRLASAKHRQAEKIPGWMAIVDELENAQIALPVIFGHHDLLPTNFLDDGSRLWLIDWEYGAFGTAMFDLANLAANNSLAPALETEMLRAYFERKPDLATQRAFLAMKAASALREALWGMVSEIHLRAPGVDYAAYAQEHEGRFAKMLTRYRAEFS